MREIRTSKAPAPVGPYSQAVEVNGFIFLSGQIGIDPQTQNLVEGFRNQVKRIFENIDAILMKEGISRSDIVKITIYLKDIKKFKELNEIYEEFFKEVPVKPARVTVGVNELPLGAEVEIEVIAVKK
ncbi:MAG TPA: deaminase [Aquifex aeolicus]|nr:deaminase [Aquifex aeolicus]